jgi:putative transposase
MNKKHQPSEKIQLAIDELVHNPFASRDFVTDLNLQGLQFFMQRALEVEASDALGRGWYAHQEKDAPVRGYRNGYAPRTIKTAQGTVVVQRPKLRGTLVPFRSKLCNQLRRLGTGLTRLVTEMYVRGLSTRDIEETLQDADGKPLLSRTAISRLTDELYREYEAFVQRDLSEIDAAYVFADGVYESVRAYTHGQTILCAWAILADGQKVLLHLAAVESESEVAWTQFFEELLARGMRHPLLVISDGAKGLHAAIHKAFPKADRQRCIAHKLRNLGAKLPKDQDKRKPVLAEVTAIYYAPDRSTADTMAAAFIEKHIKTYPAMVACFNDDLEACLTHLRYPLGHRKFIRTTNMLERTFEEEKRRTKVIPAHTNEHGAMKLVFGVLIRVARKWNRIVVNDLELAQLRNLRDLKAHSEEKKFISYRLAA